MSNEEFTPTEPGLSHPLTRCTVSLTDDGRLVIMAGDNCGIVLDEETGVIAIFGTEIRFLTESIKVNGKTLNTKSLEPMRDIDDIGSQVRKINDAKGK